MPTERLVRVRPGDVDMPALVEQLRQAPEPTEAQIDAWAAEDGDVWTEAELANADLVPPPMVAEAIRALRERHGLTQVEFARRFGLTVDALRQYEQGRRGPTGAAATLLWVIAAEPEAVMRAIARVRQRRGQAYAVAGGASEIC